jgi:hypothetical protein
VTWDITIGPERISRTPDGGLIDGRIIYRHGIECLEFEEDFTTSTWYPRRLRQFSDPKPVPARRRIVKKLTG